MAMSYKVIEKINPRDPKGDKMFGAQVVYKGEFTYKELCQNISLRCSMTDSDVEAVLQAFITNVTIMVLNSKNVALGNLGYMTGALGTDLINDPEIFSQNNIRGMRIVFVPSSDVKNELTKVKLTKIEVK